MHLVSKVTTVTCS